MTKKTPKNKTTKTTRKTTRKKTTTKLPKGVSQEEFLLALDNITRRLASKFRFAYHSVEDMKQQAAIFALEGLKNYDSTRPLENFLWTHVRNRLFNYKRNNYQRPDNPCTNCPFFDKHLQQSQNQCSKFVNKLDCELYAPWAKRNEAKKNIIQPNSMDNSTHLSPSTSYDSIIENKEIIKFLDANIGPEFRESYLKLKNGIKVSKSDIKKLQTYIFKLMENKDCQTLQPPKNEDN
jgi:hypothetical protein